MTVTIDGIISGQVSRGESYAGTAASYARDAITAASGYISLNTPSINWRFSSNVDLPETTDQTINATFNMPTKPDAFDKSQIQWINPVAAINAGAIPDIDIDNLFAGDKPIFTTADFTQLLPETDFDTINNVLAAIAVPTIKEYQAPSLSTITVNAMPSVDVPTFAPSTIVTDAGEAPAADERYQLEYDKAITEIKGFVDDNLNSFENQYAPGYRTALATAEQKIADVFTNGSILDPEYENNIYKRARGRVHKETNRGLYEVKNFHRKRGFVIMQDSLLAQSMKVINEGANNLANQATDIAIKRTETEVQQAQFVLTLSAQMRDSMRQSFMQYAGLMAQINAQANDKAKAIASLILDAYRAALERMGRLNEVLRTEAAIYETALKASLAQLDVYKLELEGLRLTADIDELKVKQYASLIQAEQDRIEMFVALLKSVETRANVERSKVEVFAEAAKAYVAQLSGEEVKNKIFLAGLQGDEYKMKGQLAKLEAHELKLKSEDTRVRAQTDIERLKGEQNKMLIDIYRNDLDTFKSELSAESQRHGAELQGDVAVIEAYIKNLQAKLQILGTEFERNKMELQKAEGQAKIDTDSSLKNADLWMSHLNMLAQITGNITNVYANMAGSSFSSLGTMVSQQSTA